MQAVQARAADAGGSVVAGAVAAVQTEPHAHHHLAGQLHHAPQLRAVGRQRRRRLRVAVQRLDVAAERRFGQHEQVDAVLAAVGDAPLDRGKARLEVA